MMMRRILLFVGIPTMLAAIVAWTLLQAAGPQGNPDKSAASSPPVINRHQPLQLPNANPVDPGNNHQELRETYRSFYVDLAAALFGWLAVAFALVTVGFAIVGIREFRDVKRQIEQELRAAIHTQLNERIQDLTEQTIRPKIQTILNEELKKNLDQAVAQFDEEVTKSLQDKEFNARLVDTVFDEIKARLSKPQTPAVSSKEFEPQ